MVLQCGGAFPSRTKVTSPLVSSLVDGGALSLGVGFALADGVLVAWFLSGGDVLGWSDLGFLGRGQM